MKFPHYENQKISILSWQHCISYSTSKSILVIVFQVGKGEKGEIRVQKSASFSAYSLFSNLCGKEKCLFVQFARSGEHTKERKNKTSSFYKNFAIGSSSL